MKPTSINFHFSNVNSGSAVIVDSHLDVHARAEEAFGSESVTVRCIGKHREKKQTQKGYTDTYEVYESYVDSGSNDYYYFAVMISSREN